MTEHEYMDLSFTLIERSENAGLAFLTVVSGYLIVAYLVGSRLTRPQVTLISALFVGYSLAQVLAQVSQIHAISQIDQILWEAFPESPLQSEANLAKLGYLWPVLELAAILASLHFMWSVRHPKTQ